MLYSLIEELSFVEEFRYLGHVVTATVEMIRILENNSGSSQFRKTTMLGRKFSFAPVEAKIQLFKSY